MKRAGMKVVCMVLAGCMAVGTVGCRNRTQEVETETLTESVAASEKNASGKISFTEKMETEANQREESRIKEETDNKTSAVKKDTVVKTEDGEMIIVPQENSQKDSGTAGSNNKQSDSKKNNNKESNKECFLYLYQV